MRPIKTIRSESRLTHLVHELVRQVIDEGDTVIDATAGNGHDTLFLRSCVGETGRVVAIDVQAAALAQVRERLIAATGELGNVTLILGCHSRLSQNMADQNVERAHAILFNLGYLPGSDHALTTRPNTTLAALSDALNLLTVGGILTVLVYTGHPGGVDELEAVQRLASDSSSTRLTWSHYVSLTAPENAPQLFVARRVAESSPSG